VTGGGYLKEWEYDSSPQPGKFGTGFIQSWYIKGIPGLIYAKTGPGVTFGFIKDGNRNINAIVAAIPLSSLGGNPDGQVEIAWKDRSLGTSIWNKLDDSNWGNVERPRTTRQPGFAYASFNFGGNRLYEGRYYLAWNPPTKGGIRGTSLMMQTEGNNISDAAIYNRFAWLQKSIGFVNSTSYGTRNVSLVYDGIGKNLRAARTRAPRDPSKPSKKVPYPFAMFYPVADGIFNGTLKDFDDYQVIHEHLGRQLRNKRAPTGMQ